jgi:probable F420-dependent oxidoreductase
MRSEQVTITLGSVGVWAHESLLSPQLATELERLGYGAIWLGGSPGGELRMVDPLLDATEHLVVATGITNIWADEAAPIAAATLRLQAAYPSRFLLGVGAGHPEATQEYKKPYDAVVDYLDVLDRDGVSEQGRVLAALGPKMLRLSATRALGAHPYLVTPEHTKVARETLGASALLAPEQKVVVDTDTERARARGRKAVENPYLHLTNYVSNLKRLGYSDADVADGGSDRLIDDLVAHGDATVAVDRIKAHLDAGADHVAIQLLAPRDSDPLDGYRAIAEAAGLTS